MFELNTTYCPNCGIEVHERLNDGETYECNICHKRYVVLIDKKLQKTGFVSVDGSALVNPLGLPKGSIRAITAISLALTCWLLIFFDHPVPSYLLSLLLTVLGYYYALRRKGGTQDYFYDASKPVERPLSLPSGSIRNFLILGFLASFIVLVSRERPLDPAYIEFFIIVAGLVAGHLLSRVLQHITNVSVINIFGHLKGLVVLGSVVLLMLDLLTNTEPQFDYSIIILSCIISFYFGSRS